MYRVLCLALCLASVMLASDVFFLPTQAVATVPRATAVPSATTTANIEEKVFQAINRFRAEQNLVPLSMAKDLAEVARRHSQDMAAREYFDHVSPDGNTLRKRVIQSGITNWTRLAENIAMNFGQLDPAEVAVRGWLNSQGHRLNILDQDLTETGIGVAVDAKGRIYLTQLFARRR